MENQFDIKLDGEIPSREEFIASKRRDPNNLSYWYPKIKDAGILTPKTIILSVPDDTVFSFFREEEGDDERLKAFVHCSIMPAIHKIGGTPFLKNGCFSNKFEFRDCAPNELSEEKILESFIRINLASACVGAEGYTEFIVRDRIPAPADAPRIYGGMPLQTEFRVFYDFDAKRPLYCVNYWDHDYCIGGLHGKDIDVFEAATPEILNVYEQFVSKILLLCRKKLCNVKGLKGVWSVDILLDHNYVPWLIDMAVANKSAYWDPTKALMFSFEEEYWKTLEILAPKEVAALRLNAPAGHYTATTEDVRELWKERRLPFLLEKANLDRDRLIEKYLPDVLKPFLEKYSQSLETILEMSAAKRFCYEIAGE